MDLKTVNSVFLIGVGGIGMSALARYFKSSGKLVAGYDKTASDLTLELESEGIMVNDANDPATIPVAFQDPQTTLIVYTPAVSLSNPILQWFKTRYFNILKRAEVLGLITKTQKGICIAGTHGKTTVSTMVSHLLKKSSLDCNAFLGGISLNYNSNLLLSKESDLVVVEADEYDRSFHQLNPYLAVITSIDADHLDIYGTYENLKLGFDTFAALVDPDGYLILKKGLSVGNDIEAKVFTYDINSKADFYADNIRVIDGAYIFDFISPRSRLLNFTLGVPGKLNLENAIAALTVAYILGATETELRVGLNGFKGIRRRFEFHYKSNTRVYIDDYAHHPEEIRATLNSLRDLYPNKRITGVFQPHLYSRTRDFAIDFAKSLGLLDELILLDIYPAREEPLPGVSPQLILDHVTIEQKKSISKDALIEEIGKRKPELLITMGAGDIGDMVQDIKQQMLKLDA